MDPSLVHSTLARHQLADGMPFVLDLEKSHGSWLHDSVSGVDYLDMFTCFASWPIGYNHPRLDEEEFLRELVLSAKHKPSNSDLYTEQMATFVETFAAHVTPDGFPHHFWVSGGALAVENALKAAFDWKARKLGRTRWTDEVNDLVVLHFREAFHGRSGYTLSLTNTDGIKTGLFPKFEWPRVHNPKIEFDLDGQLTNDIEASEKRACGEIDAAFHLYGKSVAAIIIEPMQGEGGDNYFRPEFFSRLRQYADEHEALLIYDEVQTGFYGSGKQWLWQHHGIAPDIVSFGKKSQVCGIYSNRRIEEVEDNVFALGGRINSTWGGNLTDMVRCRRFIEIIESENLCDHILGAGERMILGLREALRNQAGFSNVRGVGSLIAFTLETPQARDQLMLDLQKARLLCLKSGVDSLRFRLPLNITLEEVDQAIEMISSCLPAASARA